MKKGTITVFFSFIILIVFALICSMIESVRVQGVGMQLESAADAGMMSIFAGFNKELYKQYGLFFFDGSFGNPQLNTEIIEGKLQDYMEYNVNPVKDSSLKNTDLYHIKNLEPDITKLVLATDDNGYVFRECVVAQRKSTYGIDVAETLINQYEWSENADKQEQQYQQREQETQSDINLLEEEKAAVDLQDQEAAEAAGRQENPAASVAQIKSMGILELVCNEQFNISQKSINANELPSKRTLNRGAGLADYGKDTVSEILFHSYILEEFTNALSDSEIKNTTDNLQYQVEYILIGKEHDVDNLKGVAARLLGIREGANFAYLLTDKQKLAEAELMSAALVGYTGIVPLIEATKYALLLSWAYAESIVDVKSLLAGGKVALIKTCDNWKTGLGNLASIESQKGDQQGDSDGLEYKDYLRMLLFLADKEKTALRCLDVIEIDIRKTAGNQNLKMDYCVYKLEAEIKAESKSVFSGSAFMNGYPYSFTKQFSNKKSYGYDMR